VVPIVLPPLRARRDDIPFLVQHFAARFVEQHPDQPRREISGEVLRRLVELPCPGNVRDIWDLGLVLPVPIPEAKAGLAAEIVPLRAMTRRYVDGPSVRPGASAGSLETRI
jgi:hypothetical protein